jgi:hypothetical protein
VRYQLSSNWPVGQYVIPATSFIDAAVPMSMWSRIAGNTIPPPNAMPLDQNTYNIMRQVYLDRNIPVVGPGIVRSPDLGNQ